MRIDSFKYMTEGIAIILISHSEIPCHHRRTMNMETETKLGCST